MEIYGKQKLIEGKKKRSMHLPVAWLDYIPEWMEAIISVNFCHLVLVLSIK